jgi:hypothetical protein
MRANLRNLRVVLDMNKMGEIDVCEKCRVKFVSVYCEELPGGG